MTAEVRSHDLARRLERTRAETFRLFDLVRDEADLRRPPAEGFRPILWHRGHIGAYEAYWLLQQSRGEPSPNPQFEAMFDPIKTPRDDASNLPPIAEIDAYLADVRERVLASLERPLTAADLETYHLVLEHELQHQETLLYLLHLLDPSTKRRPSDARERARGVAAPESVVEVPGGTFEIGALGAPFVYDNESPPHRVEVAPFRVDRRPVTNAQYGGFVDGGGYAVPEFWSDEGWAWREKTGVEAPHAWIRDGRSWRLRGLFEHGAMAPDEPVWGVSWYEADAYARWAGRRLPTEREWEFLARGPRSARFPWGDADPTADRCAIDDPTGGPVAAGSLVAGASPLGVLDLVGNVWEWTSSPFDGYPGFRVQPYPEYSELWFDGDHRVARGASWATRPAIARTTFRNFFRRPFRIGFVGFRLAD